MESRDGGREGEVSSVNETEITVVQAVILGQRRRKNREGAKTCKTGGRTLKLSLFDENCIKGEENDNKRQEG